MIKASWPASILNPNKPAHWAQKAKAKKEAFNEGFVTGKHCKPEDNGEDIVLEITFCPPTRRSFDLDNLLASMKAYLDGMAKAWRIDDRRFNPIIVKRGPVVKGGQVLIRMIE